MASGPVEGFSAFFYTLVSSDTKESFFSAKRQQYLVDQGYTFKVVQDLADVADKESVVLRSHDQEMALLEKALTFRTEELDAKESRAVEKTYRGEVEGEDEPDDRTNELKFRPNPAGFKRKVSTLGAISGADGMLYSEFLTKK
jgi:DNA excision repair protein ERCC-3